MTVNRERASCGEGDSVPAQPGEKQKSALFWQVLRKSFKVFNHFLGKWTAARTIWNTMPQILYVCRAQRLEQSSYQEEKWTKNSVGWLWLCGAYLGLFFSQVNNCSDSVYVLMCCNCIISCLSWSYHWLYNEFSLVEAPYHAFSLRKHFYSITYGLTTPVSSQVIMKNVISWVKSAVEIRVYESADIHEEIIKSQQRLIPLTVFECL